MYENGALAHALAPISSSSSKRRWYTPRSGIALAFKGRLALKSQIAAASIAFETKDA